MLTGAVLVLGALCAPAAQERADPVATARSWRRAHERAIVDEFRAFLRIPNLGRDRPNIARNAAWIRAAFGARGVATRLLEVRGAPPVVYGAIEVPDAVRTVVFYVHYDGQPVDRTRWTACEPYEPTLYSRSMEDGGERVPWPDARYPLDPESRIYARSSGDDKAPIIALLAALDALREARIEPRCNIKFFFEGEEELGSFHLKQIVTKYRELLAADAWIFCDGPVHQSRAQQVVFGVRGVTGLQITVFGARRELHSGHYGNWAPNPAMLLAQLLSTMKDERGRVLVDGFYDQVEPLSAAGRRALAAVPSIDAALRDELWLGATEGDGARLEERINLPSLNVRGLLSANVGRLARNVVPSTATAAIDIRLVKGMDPRATVDKVVAHVRDRGYHVVEDGTEPDAATRREHARICKITRRSGYRAVRAPMDSAVGRAVVAAVRTARKDVIELPTLGGSLPLYVFEEVLDRPVIIVPIANHDNNQHAPDENLRVQNLWDGIETMAALLAMEW